MANIIGVLLALSIVKRALENLSVLLVAQTSPRVDKSLKIVFAFELVASKIPLFVRVDAR